MQVDTNDNTQMVLSIDSSVVGQVVVSAIYTTTGGDLVFANPVIALSNPPAPGATMTNIELMPPSVALNVGQTIPTQIWGDYSNGSQMQLYTQPGQVAYASSNPQVASANTNGLVTLNSAGSATIQASYGGYSAQMAVSTSAPLVPQLMFEGKTNESYGFSILGSRGLTNVVQFSTNLVDWSPLSTFLSTNSLMRFEDMNASNLPLRFYRVVIPAF